MTDTGVSLTPSSAARVSRATDRVEHTTRERHNVTPRASVGVPIFSPTVVLIAEVTGSKSLGSGLHPAQVYRADSTAAPIEWEAITGDCHVLPMPGQTLATGAKGVALLVGVYEGAPVYTLGESGDAGECRSMLVGRAADSVLVAEIPAGTGKCSNVAATTLYLAYHKDLDAPNVGAHGGWVSGPRLLTLAGGTAVSVYLNDRGEATATLTVGTLARPMTFEGCDSRGRSKFTIFDCLFCSGVWGGPCGDNKITVYVSCGTTCGGNPYPSRLEFTTHDVPGEGDPTWFPTSAQKSFFKGMTFDPVELVLGAEFPTWIGSGEYPDGTDDGSFGDVGEIWHIPPVAGDGPRYAGSGYMTKPNGRRYKFVLQGWLETSGSGVVCFSGVKLWYPYDYTNTFDEAPLAPHTHRLEVIEDWGKLAASTSAPPAYPFSGDTAGVPGVSFSEGPDSPFSYTIPVAYTVDGLLPGAYDPCDDGGGSGSGGGDPAPCPPCAAAGMGATLTITGGAAAGSYSGTWSDSGGFLSLLIPIGDGGYIVVVCGGPAGWDGVAGGTAGAWHNSAASDGPPATIAYDSTDAAEASQYGPGGTAGDPVTSVTVVTCAE